MAKKTIVTIMSVEEDELISGRFKRNMETLEVNGIYMRDYTEDENAAVGYANGEHCILC